jgi:hypothetical protein
MGAEQIAVNIPADLAIQTGRTPRRKTRVAAVLAVGSVVAIAFGCNYRLPSPDGVYYDPYIGSIGDAYWVFEKGRLGMRTPESGPEEFLGTYGIEGGRWVMRNPALSDEWMAWLDAGRRGRWRVGGVGGWPRARIFGSV